MEVAVLSRCERQCEAVSALCQLGGQGCAQQGAKLSRGVCFVALLFRLRDLLVRLGKLM